MQKLTFRNKLMRSLWRIVWLLLFRPTPRIFHPWRVLLLRLFGARLGRGVHPYPSVRIWAPWNLVMGDHSCLSNDVDCYCVDKVVIGERVTVSQYSYLCTATRDYNDPDMPLMTAPIQIGAYAWITADVFVGPGVTIGEGSVIGARSTVIHDVKPWIVVAGNPVKVIGERKRNLFHGLPDDI